MIRRPQTRCSIALDPFVLAIVDINAESRVKVAAWSG